MELIEKGKIQVSRLKQQVQELFDYSVSDETIESCILNLNFQFIRLDNKIVKIDGSQLRVDKDLTKALLNPIFKKFLLDATHYSIQLFTNVYKRDTVVGGLIRYHKYSRKDVCRILNWPLDISSTVYGYRTNQKVTPCFVTYHKSDEVSETTNYNDHFIDQGTFAWESRSQRKLESKEIQNVINSDRILLFVKKEDGEGTDFYYMGDCSILDGSIKQSMMPNSKIPIVHFSFLLDEPVEDGLYRYIEDN